VLIARAPVRISLAGGGTDLPAYYAEHGGLVVSTSIDKYFYIFVTLNGMDSVQITSSDYHMFFRQRRGEPVLWGGDLALPRAFLHQFGIDGGISLFLASEIPPGTGLGSSSAVAVALAKALSAVRRQSLNKGELAELASFVEIEKLGMPIGRQDQYAAAFGGLNVIRFSSTVVKVEPLSLSRHVLECLERRLLLFFTGSSRDAASILKHQQASTQKHDAVTLNSLHQIKAMAETTIRLLQNGELDEFGALLHDSWEAKKRLAHGITNPNIDEWYAIARAHGARGGKLTGAGGGGFLMLYADENVQETMTAALEDRGLVRMDFRFDTGGAVVLMNSLPYVPQFGQQGFDPVEPTC
jgi:D-glycero-alpha-D-manno-heptose-7-phosphate kinase